MKFVTDRGVRWLGDRVSDAELRDATVTISVRLKSSFGMHTACGEYADLSIYNLLYQIQYDFAVGGGQ